MMRRTIFAAFIAATSLVAATVLAEGRMVSLSFRNAPLGELVSFYEALTETTVHVEAAEYPAITLQPDKRLTTAEAISFIESHCNSIGIVFTTETDGVSISADPAKMPSGIRKTPYVKAQVSGRKQEKGPTHNHRNNSATDAPPREYSPEELEKHLQDYQRAVIKAGLPPLEGVDIPSAEE